MTPFDLFKAIPGDIDISTAQRTHACRQILTSYNLPRSPVISLELSFVKLQGQLRQGGHLKKLSGGSGNGVGCHYDYWPLSLVREQPIVAARSIVYTPPAGAPPASADPGI